MSSTLKCGNPSQKTPTSANLLALRTGARTKLAQSVLTASLQKGERSVSRQDFCRGNSQWSADAARIEKLCANRKKRRTALKCGIWSQKILTSANLLALRAVAVTKTVQKTDAAGEANILRRRVSFYATIGEKILKKRNLCKITDSEFIYFAFAFK